MPIRIDAEAAAYQASFPGTSPPRPGDVIAFDLTPGTQRQRPRPAAWTAVYQRRPRPRPNATGRWRSMHDSFEQAYRGFDRNRYPIWRDWLAVPPPSPPRRRDRPDAPGGVLTCPEQWRLVTSGIGPPGPARRACPAHGVRRGRGDRRLLRSARHGKRCLGPRPPRRPVVAARARGRDVVGRALLTIQDTAGAAPRGAATATSGPNSTRGPGYPGRSHGRCAQLTRGRAHPGAAGVDPTGAGRGARRSHVTVPGRSSGGLGRRPLAARLGGTAARHPRGPLPPSGLIGSFAPDRRPATSRRLGRDPGVERPWRSAMAVTELPEVLVHRDFHPGTCCGDGARSAGGRLAGGLRGPRSRLWRTAG